MRFALVLFCSLVLAPSAQAQRSEPESSALLVVGVYLPASAIATIGEKAKLVSNLAQALSVALGQPVVGRSYAKMEDLVRDAPSLAFALVDAPVAVTLGLPLSALAVATQKGLHETRLCVYAPPSVSFPLALEGKRLAYPRLGPVTNALLDHFLFEGFFAISRTLRVPVPDAASALAAVRVGKADAAVLTEATFSVMGGSSDLRAIVVSRKLPLAIFAKGGANLDASVVERARAAITAFSAPSLGIDGFVGLEPATLSRFARLLTQGSRLEPSVAEPKLSFRGPTFTSPIPDIPLPPLRTYLPPVAPPPEP